MSVGKWFLVCRRTMVPAVQEYQGTMMLPIIGTYSYNECHVPENLSLKQ